MADTKTSNETAASALTGAELVRIVQGGNNRKTTTQDIANLGGAGSGDVVGPASAVADRIATFDGTTGKLIKDGGATIADLQANPAIENVAGTTYTQLAADDQKWKRLTSGAPVTVTIDANVNSAEDEITFEQAGAGAVSFVAGVGMTLNSRGSVLGIAGVYGVVGIKFISATEATLFGDLA